MTEFYRLSNILAWRVEYFVRIMCAYQVADCILNYETSNATSALRRVDYILGEKNA